MRCGFVGLLLSLLTLAGCRSHPLEAASAERPTEPTFTVRHAPSASASSEGGVVAKTDQDWQQQLTAEQYRVTRQCGTEPPGTGKWLHNKAAGTYHCVCCGAALFASYTKYDSGSGWPSFWAAVEDANVKRLKDTSHGMARTEVRCGKCDAHLGHVFDDGPRPTGQRYCINSAALDFEPADKAAGDTP